MCLYDLSLDSCVLAMLCVWMTVQAVAASVCVCCICSGRRKSLMKQQHGLSIGKLLGASKRAEHTLSNQLYILSYTDWKQLAAVLSFQAWQCVLPVHCSARDFLHFGQKTWQHLDMPIMVSMSKTMMRGAARRSKH